MHDLKKYENRKRLKQVLESSSAEFRHCNYRAQNLFISLFDQIDSNKPREPTITEQSIQNTAWVFTNN